MLLSLYPTENYKCHRSLGKGAGIYWMPLRMFLKEVEFGVCSEGVNEQESQSRPKNVGRVGLSHKQPMWSHQQARAVTKSQVYTRYNLPNHSFSRARSPGQMTGRGKGRRGRSCVLALDAFLFLIMSFPAQNQKQQGWECSSVEEHLLCKVPG
jgi:hypothetical protein